MKEHAIKNGIIDREFARSLYGKLCLVLSFVTWVVICIWMMANRFQNVLGTKFRFGDIIFGVSLPFDVPSLQIPTAIFSFSFGLTKILILAGKVIKMVVDKCNETKNMGADKLNEAKDSIMGVVPGDTVEAQNDDNAAVMGAGEVTIEGNALEMAKEMAEEQIQEEIQAKFEEQISKFEEKITEKIKGIGEKIKEKLGVGDESVKVTKEIENVCQELLNENKALKNETNKQQNQIQKLQDKINRLMKEIKGGRGKQNDGGGVLVHPQSKSGWSSISQFKLGKQIEIKKSRRAGRSIKRGDTKKIAADVQKLARTTSQAHNKKIEARKSVASKRLQTRLSSRESKSS